MKYAQKYLGIISCAVIIAFTQTGCPPEHIYTRTHSGTIYANANGSVTFEFISWISWVPYNTRVMDCTFTTNLPDPHNSFILKSPSDDESKKTIGGLNPGQPVKWTAVCDDYECGSLKKEQERSWVTMTAYAPLD